MRLPAPGPDVSKTTHRLPPGPPDHARAHAPPRPCLRHVVHSTAAPELRSRTTRRRTDGRSRRTGAHAGGPASGS